jgi:hypothetical protein
MQNLEARTNRFHDLQQPAPAPLPVEMSAMIWTHTGMLNPAWDVLQAVTAWPRIIITPHRSGMCLQLDGVTLGQLRWNGRIVLPFGPEMRRRLLIERMAMRDPDQIDRESLVFDVRTMEDVHHAVWLLRLAYLNVGVNKDANVLNGGSPCT